MFPFLKAMELGYLVQCYLQPTVIYIITVQKFVTCYLTFYVPI